MSWTYEWSGACRVIALLARLTEIIGATDKDRITKASQEITDRSRVLFDLNSGPVIRAELLRLGADDHILLVVIHHIVADHWILGIIADEISALYAVHAGGSLLRSNVGKPPEKS